jgi:alpha-galactosidase
MSVDAYVYLTASGCSVLVDLTGGRLPAIQYWGTDLGALTEDQARAAAEAQYPVVGVNQVDKPVRLALLPEHHTGWVGRPGLSGSRAGRAWSTKFEVRSAHVSGSPVRTFAAAGPAVLEVTATDAEACLDLTLILELLPSGLLRSRAAVTNSAVEPFQVDGLALAYRMPAHATELLDFAGRWARERVPQRAPFDVGIRLREGRRGRTGPDAAMVLHAGTAGFGFGRGEVWGVHTAWSGNHVHYAERTFDGHRVVGGGELLLPGEVRLGHGETYEGPWIYGSYGVGLDACARRFHEHLRGTHPHLVRPRPVTLNTWEAVYFDHDLDVLLELADRAGELGVERFVLDDGWFGSRRDDRRGLGDWFVSADVWPQGLHPLTERVTKLGLQFGLWIEPEMVNPDSDLARAHPDWVLSARGEWPVEQRHQQVLNLAIPECYDYVLGRILALLDEYPIAFLKWDHNRDLIEAGDQTREHRPAAHAHTVAVYRMLSAIKARHPRLEIESCSSGGGRVDLGVLEMTDRVWVSDCIDPLERQLMLRWTAQLLPLEMLGSHVGANRSHTTGRMHDLNFRAATAVFGHFGIEWNLLDLSERATTELSAWLDFYKQHRALLHSGDLVRMDDVGDGTSVQAVIARDRSEALIAFAVVEFPLADPGPNITVRGLEPARTYRVRPVFVSVEPSGLQPPGWWGEPSIPRPQYEGHPILHVVDAAEFPGSTFTGAVLEHIGMAPPILHPEQAVLFHAVAEPG